MICHKLVHVIEEILVETRFIQIFQEYYQRDLK